MHMATNWWVWPTDDCCQRAAKPFPSPSTLWQAICLILRGDGSAPSPWRIPDLRDRSWPRARTGPGCLQPFRRWSSTPVESPGSVLDVPRPGRRSCADPGPPIKPIDRSQPGANHLKLFFGDPCHGSGLRKRDRLWQLVPQVPMSRPTQASGTHRAPAADERTAASMKATPFTPSSMVGKCTSGAGAAPLRAAMMPRATSA